MQEAGVAKVDHVPRRDFRIGAGLLQGFETNHVQSAPDQRPQPPKEPVLEMRIEPFHGAQEIVCDHAIVYLPGEQMGIAPAPLDQPILSAHSGSELVAKTVQQLATPGDRGPGKSLLLQEPGQGLPAGASVQHAAPGLVAALRRHPGPGRSGLALRSS